jgi:hypothetical protein
VWYPLLRAAEEVERGEKRRVLYSLISAEVPDALRDTVRQAGMDCEPLLAEGYVNWDHGDGPENLIGEPLTVNRKELENGTPATESRFFLYRGHPRADSVWSLAQAQQRDPMSKRRLGTSVQGEIVERQAHDIVRSVIRHLAVSHQPLMPLSFVAVEKMTKSRAALARAMSAGTDSPLNTLNLDAGGWIYGPCRGGRTCYRRDLSFRGGSRGAMAHLVRCRGMDPGMAKRLLLGMYRTLTA